MTPELRVKVKKTLDHADLFLSEQVIRLGPSPKTTKLLTEVKETIAAMEYEEESHA